MTHESNEGHAGDAMDVSYGGLNLTAKGSIVVLVILLAGQSVFTFLTYGWVMQKIDVMVNSQTVGVGEIVSIMHKHRGEVGSENRSLRDDIVRNREYLREVARTCLLTNDQKVRFQQQMSPALKELMMRDYLLDK